MNTETTRASDNGASTPGSPPTEINKNDNNPNQSESQVSSLNQVCKEFGFSNEEDQQTTKVREAAHNYTAAGISVIETGQNEIPLKTWAKYQSEITTTEEINRDFSLPETCIAVIPGKISGNLEIIDIDNRGELLDRFIAGVNSKDPAIIPKLLHEKTQAGGDHFAYRCPEVEIPGSKKLAKSYIVCPGPEEHEHNGKEYKPKKCGDKWVAEICEIETRSERSYCLVAPSPGYELKSGSYTDLPKLSQEERQILLDVAKSLDQPSPFKSQTSPYAANQQTCNKTSNACTSTSGLSPGDDFNIRGNFGEMLVGRDWEHAGSSTTSDGASAENYRRPGKTEGNSASVLDDKFLYVFSTNAAPLDGNKSYSKFALYALLYCDGDFKQAAAELREQGYGDKKTDEPAKEPILDKKALAGFAGRFVELACRNSEADPVAVLMTFLARVAVEFGNGIILMVGDTKHYARLFAAIVGASSKARKGTSAKPIYRLFETVHNAARVSPGPFSSGEGIIFAVRDEVIKWRKPTAKTKGAHYTDDPGVDDKRFFVLDEELGNTLTCVQRDGNTASTVLRKAWDDGNLDPITKTNKISATNAHIGWLSHITITELLHKLSESDTFSGFANRIDWVFAKRQKEVPFPEPMPDHELRDFQKELQQILNHSKSVKKLELDKSARDLWLTVYSELSKDHPGLVGCIINRAEAQVLRLAMVYCLLDQSVAINRSHLEAALALWDYCRDSAYYIFFGQD